MLRTFFARMSAKSFSTLSPTRWPKRSLISLNRSRSARARQNGAPVRCAFSSSSAKAVSKFRRLPISVTGSHASFLRALEVVLQLKRAQSGLLKLATEAGELVAHLAIILDEGQHDLVDR